MSCVLSVLSPSGFPSFPLSRTGVSSLLFSPPLTLLPMGLASSQFPPGRGGDHPQGHAPTLERRSPEPSRNSRQPANSPARGRVPIHSRPPDREPWRHQRPPSSPLTIAVQGYKPRPSGRCAIVQNVAGGDNQASWRHQVAAGLAETQSACLSRSNASLLVSGVDAGTHLNREVQRCTT